MSIAGKEARETQYWIKLLIETEYLNIGDKHIQSLVRETEEINKLLTSIVKSSQVKQ